jgi:hypothetical protein
VTEKKFIHRNVLFRPILFLDRQYFYGHQFKKKFKLAEKNVFRNVKMVSILTGKRSKYFLTLKNKISLI